MSNFSSKRGAGWQGQWYQGDLHTHTDHSDGCHTIEEAIDIAKGVGLDFIALTDHNTVTQNHLIKDDSDFALIPGVEFTTRKGHVNFLGVKTPVASYRHQNLEGVAATMAEAAVNEAYISINHPFIGDKWEWGFEGLDYNAVELWNGTSLWRNEEVIRWWQEQLAQGNRIYINGSSDVHEDGKDNRWYGKGRTWIFSEKLSARKLIEALKSGHNAVAASGESAFCTISVGDAMMGDTARVSQEQLILRTHVESDREGVFRLYGSKGLVTERRIKALKETFQLTLSPDSLFYRAEVWQKDNSGDTVDPFFTNPIFIER